MRQALVQILGRREGACFEESILFSFGRSLRAVVFIMHKILVIQPRGCAKDCISRVGVAGASPEFQSHSHELTSDVSERVRHRTDSRGIRCYDNGP